jgi:hypothetical protein
MLKIILFLFLSGNVFAARVRHVEVTKDEIVPVRTSIGIATIIQVPDRPNSVVVGDQDSFKVEYLDQAITIKPLVSGARSNLYVYTDYRRFNIELITGPQAVSDYVVYLKQPKTKKPDPVQWKQFSNSLSNDEIRLAVKRIGTFNNEILLIEFELTSKSKLKFRPDWLWLTQNGEFRPIHNLVFSALDLNAGKKVSGLMQVRKIDLNPMENFRIEVRRSKITFLTLPKVGSWSL